MMLKSLPTNSAWMMSARSAQRREGGIRAREKSRFHRMEPIYSISPNFEQTGAGVGRGRSEVRQRAPLGAAVTVGPRSPTAGAG